jgi:dTDP-3-amino-3,4,6-trideoxy-alpha-D-glucose transaminase
MSVAPVSLNDFVRQWNAAGSDVLSAVREVGESGYYILGKQVAAFEAELARFSARKHAVGCANGLDAIEISLRSLDIAPGDKVLTTPLSAFATTLAVLRAGGIPVFVDVDETGLLDLSLVEAALAADASIRFLLPVHLYGQVLDLTRLAAIKKRFGVKIVEDMAQAIGAHSGDLAVGSVGELAATSFYPTKNLGAIGDGGALFTDDRELDRRCRALRDYGQTQKYVHDVPGLNSRLDELHAAVLLRAFLPRLAGWTERRRQIAQTYLAGIRHPQIRPLPAPANSRSVWHLFPTHVPAARRDTLMAYLREAGIGSAVHYPRLIPDQGALAGATYQVLGDLRRAKDLAECELSLPIHPYLTDEEVGRVIDAVNAWPTS